MSFLTAPVLRNPNSSRRLQPGDDGYCARCDHEGHDRTTCPDANHRNLVTGGPCPHPRRRGAASTIHPGDSASQTGLEDMSLGALLRRVAGSQPHQPGQQATVQDILSQPGYGSLTQQEAQRLADMYNNALRQANRATIEANLRAQGVDPSAVLDPPAPVSAATAAPLPAATVTAATPAIPQAPGSTQVVPFAQPGSAPSTLAHQVVIGTINVRQTQTNFAIVHRQTYDLAACQTALTAAGLGTFTSLAYLALRALIPPVNYGYIIRVRIVQQATLPAAPANQNAFTALGGQYHEIVGIPNSPTNAVISIPFQPPTNLAVPLHVIVMAQVASASNATTDFANIGIEIGANFAP